MKSILISIKPYWVEKILNKKKTIEIRKKFPKAYVGWVYIYCTKAKPYMNLWVSLTEEKCKKVIPSISEWQEDTDVDEFMNVEFVNKYPKYRGKKITFRPYNLNGKVVARFWCDNVTEYINGGQWHDDNTFGSYDDYIKDNILEKSCLAEEELFDYCEDLAFSSIHISNLVIFDKPKELNEFKRLAKGNKLDHSIDAINYVGGLPLTKAPQSWCYVERG